MHGRELLSLPLCAALRAATRLLEALLLVEVLLLVREEEHHIAVVALKGLAARSLLLLSTSCSSSSSSSCSSRTPGLLGGLIGSRGSRGDLCRLLGSESGVRRVMLLLKISETSLELDLILLIIRLEQLVLNHTDLLLDCEGGHFYLERREEKRSEVKTYLL